MNLNGGFPILYADPPWPYDNERDHKAELGGTPYDTMSIRDICALRPLIDRVAAKDSVMLMWATMPKLPEAIQVMAAWGYTYITVPFCWLKLQPTGAVELQGKDVLLKKGVYSGLGSYSAGNLELVLMGKRGRGLPRQCKSVKQVVMAPRGAHSAKPDEVRERIQKIWGPAPILELFARGARVRGVMKLGQEIDGLDIREALSNLAGSR
jgi:site-specific DNA-methyltransferase (adenine-specific)